MTIWPLSTTAGQHLSYHMGAIGRGNLRQIMALLDGTLLDSIYDGPLEEVPWQGFMVLLRRRFELVAGSLHLRLPGPDQRGFDVSDTDWDVRALREHYERYYYQYNPFSYDDMQAGVVYRWTDFISRERFIQTEYYREFCQPVGFEYALASRHWVYCCAPFPPARKLKRSIARR